MAEKKFIQLILPVKLDWEPWYYTTEQLSVGQRVSVKLSGRSYTAVVSNIGGTPDIDVSRIQPIVEIEKELEPISDKEISFWRFLSSYYMCTVGEFYKLAYPASLAAVEKKKSTRHLDRQDLPAKRLSQQDKVDLTKILEAFGQRQSVIYCSDEAEQVLAELERRCLDQGRDVLRLRPDSSRPSYVHQREMAKAVRGPEATLVDCGRSGLFLPHSKLGLVVIDREYSLSYRVHAQAPQYNVRDAAIALAAIHGADVIMTGRTPSLETLYNVKSGRYVRVDAPASPSGTCEFIGTEDEFRKNGMIGSFSRVLLLRMASALNEGGRVLLLAPWKDTRDLEIEARTHFPKARTKLSVASLGNIDDYGKYSLVALLKADFLLSRNDFRADEKAFRIMNELRSAATGKLVVQAKEPSHPVFNADPDLTDRLLLERKRFNMPPFTRLVEIDLADSNEARRSKMSMLLSRDLGGLRHFFPKDKDLQARKMELRRKVQLFEKEYHYTGHIIINVDPL